MRITGSTRAGKMVPRRSSAADETGPGEQLGRYLLQRRLGSGGMGVVYEADDMLLGRRVALKLVHRDSDPEAEHPRRLLLEAQALARLSHPNVVTVYDAGVEQGRWFLAMEYIDGGTLADVTRDMSWDEVLSAYRQAGLGLAAAHERGITHRDFKPANVLVSTDGRICVADFGLAQLSAVPGTGGGEPVRDLALTRQGVMLGTPAFMSPEQLQGMPADARSDVFSFCVALFSDLYGQAPFPGETVEELRAAVVENTVRQRPPGSRVPRWLHPVLLRGLRADPAERPSSMRILLDELGRSPTVREVMRLASVFTGGER